MAEQRRCQQVKCSFYLNGGCRTCESCKADSFIINTSCSRCLRCESVPNELRFGDREITNKDMTKEIVKPEEDEIKVERLILVER